MMDKLGLLVRQKRKARGMRQAELAKILGVSSMTVVYIEKGRHSIRFETGIRLCAELGISWDEVFSMTLDF